MRRMRLPLVVPMATFLGGVALIAAAVALGQGQVFLFLIFPGVVSSSPLALVGFLLIFLSFILGFLTVARGLPLEEIRRPEPAPPQGAYPPPVVEKRRSLGGIIFLGPIPVVFGSSRRVTTIMLVLGLAITILLVILFFLLR